MRILIIGGAGYVGSSLVPVLLKQHHQITVYDLFLYGNLLPVHDDLTLIKGDIRDIKSLVKAAELKDVVIHLASISNDPSYELNPDLGKSINYDAIYNVVEASRNVEKVLFASSASVYGVQDNPKVTEETIPNPLTDYAKYKLEAESVFFSAGLNSTTAIRFATICGYAPRLRLDLVVNIFVAHALINNKIRIFGGSQFRPNIHIRDVVRAYSMLVSVSPSAKIDGQVFNVGSVNMSLNEIADTVAKIIPDVEFENVPTDDIRSYFINSEKIKTYLGFKPEYSIEGAIRGLVAAFKDGIIIDGLNNPLYHNVKLMKEVNLQ